MRLPDRLYRLLERAYLHQTRLRRRADRDRLAAEDAHMRAHYARLHTRHLAGTCGGKAAGCCYTPCVPHVGWGIQ
jgi:hypothetical protein